MKRFCGKICAFLIALFGVFLTGCGNRAEKFTAVDTAMGTIVSQTVYGKEDVTGQVKDLLANLEAEELSWRMEGSEVAELNETAGSGRECVLSETLNEDLNLLFEVSQKSEGAFDVTIAPVVRLWNIDAWAAGIGLQTKNDSAEGAQAENEATAVIPAPEDIQAALLLTGYEKIEKTKNGLILPKGMSLDLGAAGKGIACDKIAGYLADKKVSGAVISVGGSILTYGKKPDGTPWQVAVVDPFDTSAQLGILSLDGQWYVSTSGDYERYIEVDGVRYHHIIDPETGYPAQSGLRSVTIVCKSGILSDALSTACFVLGKEKGLALAARYGAEALFVNEKGEISMTPGMKELFRQ